MQAYLEQRRRWEETQKNAQGNDVPLTHSEPVAESKPADVSLDQLIAGNLKTIEEMQSLVEDNFGVSVNIVPKLSVSETWVIQIPETPETGADGKKHASENFMMTLRNVLEGSNVMLESMNPRFRRQSDGSYLYKVDITESQMNNILEVHKRIDKKVDEVFSSDDSARNKPSDSAVGRLDATNRQQSPLSSKQSGARGT